MNATITCYLVVSKVDFDDSTSQNRFVVKPGVDENLDESMKTWIISIFSKRASYIINCFSEKRTYNGLPDFMTKVAQEELSKLDASITECNILYLPQVKILYAMTLHNLRYKLAGRNNDINAF